MKKIVSISIIYMVLISFSCSTAPKNSTATNKEKPKETELDFSAGEPTIVYKTKRDYYTKVPVVLSEDKRKIISYPHPKDIYYKEKLAVPIKLSNGYLLDNRGIRENTAFLNINYEEYAKLTSAPKLAEMEKMIIDKDPISEICNCGNRDQFENEVDELNNLINTNQLNKCKRIK